jgi:hypothetical protein
LSQQDPYWTVVQPGSVVAGRLAAGTIPEPVVFIRANTEER